MEAVKMFLTFILFVFCCSIQVSNSLDEVAEFKQILSEEKSLLVLLTEECCACVTCVEAETLLGTMSVVFENSFNLRLVRLKDKPLRKTFGVTSTPTLIFIREGQPAIYDGNFDKDSVINWIENNREPLAKKLDDDTFEHLTQAATGATTGDWLVAFYNDSCLHNNGVFAHLEGAGIHLKQRINIAIVDTEMSPETAHRFKVKNCPEVIFFRQGKMYRFNLPELSVKTLKNFAEGFYKQSKVENVPPPISNFDKLIDAIVASLKLYWSYIFFSLSALIFVIIVAFECFIKSKPPSKELSTSKKVK